MKTSYLLCAACLLIGVVAGACIAWLLLSRVAVDPPKPVGASAGWLPQEPEVTSMRIDMRCWMYYETRGKRFQLELDRRKEGSWSEFEKEAFYTILQCLREAAPISTMNCTSEATGTIELTLKDQSVVTCWVHGPIYLCVGKEGEQRCLIFDAESLEAHVRRRGQLVAEQGNP